MQRLAGVLGLFITLCHSAMAQDTAIGAMPSCVKTGAVSVFFNGKPALKLGDVAACPPATYQIIPNIVIEGQPMVHLTGCAAGSPNISADSQAANTLGDCPR